MGGGVFRITDNGVTEVIDSGVDFDPDESDICKRADKAFGPYIIGEKRIVGIGSAIDPFPYDLEALINEFEHVEVIERYPFTPYLVY